MEPKGTFGPRLRQERERRQISLSSIAANTKINQSLLEGLERDDLRRWPSGIFRRAFVRSYATAIGMDADEIWKEFSERFPDPHPPVDAAEAEAHDSHLARRLFHRGADHGGRNSKTDGDSSRRAPNRPAHEPRAKAMAAAAPGADAERVEFVFRISVPRSLASWALWAKSLASRGPAMPRSQNQNT